MATLVFEGPGAGGRWRGALWAREAFGGHPPYGQPAWAEPTTARGPSRGCVCSRAHVHTRSCTWGLGDPRCPQDMCFDLFPNNERSHPETCTL